jgi:hypothetical protein
MEPVAPVDFIEVYDDAFDRAECAELIRRFGESPVVQRGRTGAGVIPAVKDSWDITISNHAEWRDAEVGLNRAVIGRVVDYARKYPYLILGPFSTRVPDGEKERFAEAADLENDEHLRTRLITSTFRPAPINIQRYVGGRGGYPRWHSEIYPVLDAGESLHRVLLWTIYLNDAFEEGETEFFYQRRKIRPKTGSLLLAPASFTHTHRGNRPLGGDKYIATSWINFWRAERLYAPG